MADICGEHVDSDVLHVRDLRSTMDSVLFRGLEDDVHRHLGSSRPRGGYAMVNTGKCPMAGQPRSGGQGYRDSGQVRANKRH